MRALNGGFVFSSSFQLKTKTEQWNSIQMCAQMFYQNTIECGNIEILMKYGCELWGRKQLEVLTIEIGNSIRIWLMREHIIQFNGRKV